jgi:hypothetical protein
MSKHLFLLIRCNFVGRCELVFENCFVPEENVLGKEGKGLAISFVVLIIIKRKSSLYYLVGLIWIDLRKMSFVF